MSSLQKFCRIAIRAEGDFVNAYFAHLETMDDALLIASIRRGVVDTDRALFDEWREFLQRAFGVVAKNITDEELVWGDPESAPEHERSGRA